MSERIVSPTTYYAVFAALIALTCLTLVMSFVNLGDWHIVAGLAIAICKALLVALIFMHLLYSSRMTWIVAGTGLLWLAILLVLTLTDYLTRGRLPY